MPRIEPLPLEQVPVAVRPICEDAERQLGTSTSARVLARNPGVLKALADFRTALAGQGRIDPVLRELVRLKVAALNACRY